MTKFYYSTSLLTTAWLLPTFFFTLSSRAADINSFSELQTAISAGGDYSLSSDMTANADLDALGGDFTLDGNGYGINGSGSIQGLFVAAGQNVSVKNIGKSDYSASWNGTKHHFVNNGTLSLSNIYFKNNRIEESGIIDGGVIRNRGTIGTVDNIHMEGNQIISTDNNVWGGLVENGQLPSHSNTYVWDKLINSSFRNNTMYSSVGAPHGGVLYNGNATINTIDNVIFENNSMTSKADNAGGAHGVAIDNNEGGVIGVISNSVFRNNKTYRTGETVYTDGRNYHASAGAIDNYHRIGLIKNSLFEGNSAESVASNAGSGAIMNIAYGAVADSGYTGGIENSSFINNHAYSQKGNANAGAISNGAASGAVGRGVIDHVTDTVFRDNYVQSDEKNAYGGALTNTGLIGKMENVIFENNRSVGSAVARGGAVYSTSGTLGDMTHVVFKGNFVQGDTEQGQGGAAVIKDAGNMANVAFIDNYVYVKNFQSVGGAVVTSGNIGKIKDSSFSGNHVDVDVQYARGGGLFVGAGKIEGMENVSFVNNYAKSRDSDAYGGALYVRGGNLGKIVNSIFTGNYVSGTAGSKGGAIYSNVSLDIEANRGNSLFENNRVNAASNAIYMKGTDVAPINLKLSAYGGILSVRDGIDGEFYNIDVSGNNKGEVELLGEVNNAADLNIAGTTLHIGLKPLDMVNYTAGSSAFLKIDVDPGARRSGMLKVSGDVAGTSRVIINALNPKLLSEEEKIKFVEAPNDDASTASSFEIFRVYGSPNLWSASQLGNDWYMSMLRDKNPDYDDKLVTSETLAYIGLPSASIEQTRSMVGSIRSKVSSRKLLSSKGDVYEDYYRGYALYNIWINPVYYRSTGKKPVKVESDIHGFEAGLDVQGDLYNKIGVFASYRQGDYDLNGEGKHYHSTTGSEIDLKSYTGGLYYRFDRHNSWVFATLYGGKQKADIKTDDGLHTSGNGSEIGGSLEAGHIFHFDRGMRIEPNLGIFYTQTDLDDMEDFAGKTARYDKLKYAEAEVGIKFAQTFAGAGKSYADIYLKPSVVKPFSSGAKVEISGLDAKVKTYDPDVLGRFELGGRLGITSQFSGYGYADYTFGSDYEAASFGLGLSYSW